MSNAQMIVKIYLHSLKMKSKKAVELTLNAVIIAALGILVLYVMAKLLISKGAIPADNVFSSQLLKTENSQCQFNTEQAYAQGTIFSDADDDGLSDSCDTCLGYSGKVGDGSNDIDADLDGMADDCDQEPNDPKERGCKDYRLWNTEKEKWLSACCTKEAGEADISIGGNLICKTVT